MKYAAIIIYDGDSVTHEGIINYSETGVTKLNALRGMSLISYL